MEKQLVLKRIRPERVRDPRFLELFVREAELSMSLVHKNIVPVFDFGRAEEVYLHLVDDPALRNTSSWGNLIASLVYQKRSVEAVAQGLAAKEWAESQGKAFVEPFTYASILENTAQAYWQLKKYDKAHILIAAATAFRDDNLNRSNLAISFAILGRYADAELQMRRVREAATPETRSTRL